MADTTNLGLGGVQNPFLGQSNPYLQNAIDLASKDLVRNYNTVTQPAYNAAMVNSGSFGNSAINELNQNANNQLQTNLGDLASKFRYNDYTNQGQMWQDQRNFGEGRRQFDLGFGRATFNDAFSQNQQNYQNSLGLLSTLQGINQSDISNTTNQQNTPLNYWQQFSNGANSIGQGYGTSTGNSTQGTTSNPFMSAIGGAQLGTSAANWWNNRNSGYGSGTNYSNDLANLGQSNNWWGTGG